MQRLLALASLALFISTTPARGADRATVERVLETHLSEGNLTAAATAMEQNLAADNRDQHSQYGLGVVRVLQAVERLAQSLHRYGAREDAERIPLLRIPVPQNPHPEKFTYALSRAIFQRFGDDLDLAGASLEKVTDPQVKLLIPVGLIRMNLDGDGLASADETFWKVFSKVMLNRDTLPIDQQQFRVGFDAGDVHWLIGYTHLLRAMCQVILAHDYQVLHDQVGPRFFLGIEQPAIALDTPGGSDWEDEIADAIAAIHLFRLPVVEPARMSRARTHLLATMAQSRKSWELILKETDDEREWVPNSRQTSLLPLRVTQTQIDGWQTFLTEAEHVLEGRKLLPHWRFPKGSGVNLKRVFEDPREFDLVLWLHGAGAVPYLERGETVSEETSRRLQDAFGGRFFGFAAWFN